MKTLLILTIIFLPLLLFSQKSKEVSISNANGTLKGTLLTPKKPKKELPVVLIIAGSGPTDRNGNSMMTQNNSLKFFAEALAANGIASLRYDKQGVGGSANASKPEDQLLFDDFVQDAVLWLQFLKNDKRFNSVIVAGHSEGSLIALAATQTESVTKLISLAGAGRSIDQVLIEQLAAQFNEEQLAEAKQIMAQLKKGEQIASRNVPTSLQPLFRESVQPYMISWIKLNPAELVANLSIPVMIVNGTTDIQVSVEDAQLLSKASPSATFLIVENMNHIFKEAPADRESNLLTYYEPQLPLHPELIAPIVKFILAD